MALKKSLCWFRFTFVLKKQRQVWTNYTSATILFHYPSPPHHHHIHHNHHYYHHHHHQQHDHNDDDAEEAPSMRLAVETLEELDWCLDQLESLQVSFDADHHHDDHDDDEEENGYLDPQSSLWAWSKEWGLRRRNEEEEWGFGRKAWTKLF